MHVLFIIEKKLNCFESIPSNAAHNLVGSLESCNLATYSVLTLDEPNLETRIRGYFSENKADLTIVSCVCAEFLPLDTLLWAKQYSKVVFIWFDYLVCRDFEKDFINIIFDKKEYYGPTHYSLWAPQDTRIFNYGHGVRDLDVTFVGNIGSYPARQFYVQYLPKHINFSHFGGSRSTRQFYVRYIPKHLPRHLLRHMNFFHFVGSRSNRLSYEDYASIHKRSKICLNFPESLNGGYHLKGRIFEITLCGGLLMENERNEHIQRWFEPGVDYVPYTNENDLIPKIRYYLDNENERLAIANSAYNKAVSMWSTEKWWSYVINDIDGVNLLRIGNI